MATIAYKVVQAFVDLKDGDRVYRVGDDYVSDDEARIKDLLSEESEGRHESLIGVSLIEPVEHVEPDKDEPDGPEFPKHVGGGQYELSDGSKVKGKDAAVEAESALAE